jgi:hypothetical protein
MPYGNAVALHTFLDLSGWHSGSGTVVAQLPDPAPTVTALGSSPDADLDARLAAPAPPGPADEWVAAVPQQAPAGPAEETGGRSNSEEAGHAGGWTRLMNGLILLSIPVLWSHWPLGLAGRNPSPAERRGPKPGGEDRRDAARGMELPQ